MKELMKTNVYDVGESVLIVGSCLPDMEPEGFAQLCASSGHVFELCLEQTHINMAITKISAMLYTGKIRTLRFGDGRPLAALRADALHPERAAADDGPLRRDDRKLRRGEREADEALAGAHLSFQAPR